MPVTPPLDYIVRPRLSGSRAQRAAAVLLALLLLGAGFALGRWSAARVVAAPHHDASATTGAIQALKQQLAIAQRDRQVMRVAADALRRTLADRGAEIESLRADLAFYTRLIGGAEQAPGLGVAALTLSPVAGTRGYTFTVTLLQTARDSNPVHGRMTLALQGVQGGRATRCDWAQLADARQRDGLPFAFKYFQQVHGMLVLPPGFVPARIDVTLKPAGGAAFTRDLAWAGALAGKDTTHVPQNP